MADAAAREFRGSRDRHPVRAHLDDAPMNLGTRPATPVLAFRPRPLDALRLALAPQFVVVARHPQREAQQHFLDGLDDDLRCPGRGSGKFRQVHHARCRFQKTTARTSIDDCTASACDS